MPIVLLLVLVLGAIGVAGTFAASEASLSRVSQARAAELAAAERPGAAALHRLIGDPAPAVAVATLVRVMAEAVAAVGLTVLLVEWFGAWWSAAPVAVLVIGLVSFVLVGVSPRTVGHRHPVGVGLKTAPALLAMTRLLGPPARVLVAVANGMTPGGGFRAGPFATEAELRELVDLAQESAVIQAGERKMIHSVFELGDTIVREVMVPRTDMITVHGGTDLRKSLSLFLRSGFSRMPAIGDSADDVLGMVYLKDVVQRLQGSPARASEGGVASGTVDDVLRPAVFVPESKPVDALLQQMQRESTHVAVVVDEYGGTAGLVTIEDLIEEIVGEISDEYDRWSPTVERLPGGGFRLSARLHIDELAQLFGVDIDEQDVDTIGGLLAKTIGRVPIVGSRAVVEGLELVAERLEGRRNRVGTVVVRPVQPVSAGDDEQESADA